MRPFDGVKILDCTHVLAGPFATCQLAVLASVGYSAAKIAALRATGAAG